jgi:NTE family protein
MENFLRKWILFTLIMPAMAAAGSQDMVRTHKVGLVLSGGGARGASHIGVLKVLEREHIPIDCIVGTSFGSLAGGLYSIGYSGTEIEQVLSNQDWNNIFSDAPQRHLMPLIERRNARFQVQIAVRSWHLELPSGLWAGQRMTEALDLLTTGEMLDAQYDFDKLPIQFRAVATNLLDGTAYVFKQGRMSEALRASMAVPLVFTPVDKDGMLLVDGGLVDNLPTDIARALGCDLVIAVDATSPLLKKDEIRTFVDVIDQSLSLDMEKNVRENRKLADIVLRPELGRFTYSDYSEIRQIVARGAEEAENRLREIKALIPSGPPRPHKTRSTAYVRTIDSISFQGLTRIKAGQVSANLRVRPGDVVDVTALDADVGRLYATRWFDTVDYTLEPVNDSRYRLVFMVKEASTHLLGLGLRYDNDYDFVALAEFTWRHLFNTASSATISSQFGGLEDNFAAVHLVPFSGSALFFEPRAEVRRQERLDIRNQELFSTFTDKRIGGQFLIGAPVYRQFVVEGGYRIERVGISGGAEPLRLANPEILAGFTFSLYRDTLNTRNFPQSGAIARIQIDKRSPSLGADFNNSKWQADYQRYFPVFRESTFRVNASAAFSRGAVPFYDRFFVGGYSFSERASRQFLGLDRDEIIARQLVLLGGIFRRQISARSLGFLKRTYLIAAYNGLFFSSRETRPYQFHFLSGGGLGLENDTLFGPVRVVGGWGEHSRFHVYVSLGSRF